MNIKSIFSLIFAIFIAACASTPNISPPSYIKRAEVAISEQRWQIAYRFLEDGLISSELDAKDKVITLYQTYPQLRLAAAETFSQDVLINSFDISGFISGVTKERHRLKMYSVVATDDELAVATNNLQYIAGNYEALKLKSEKDAQEKAVAVALDLQNADRKLQKEFEDSKSAAIFKCKDKIQCDKAFALTQIFIASYSDMKIQLANETIIETYNPVQNGAMGASAYKFPQEGTSAEIRLSLSCKFGMSKSEIDTCKRDVIRLNFGYEKFLQSRLFN